MILEMEKFNLKNNVFEVIFRMTNGDEVRANFINAENKPLEEMFLMFEDKVLNSKRVALGDCTLFMRDGGVKVQHAMHDFMYLTTAEISSISFN